MNYESLLKATDMEMTESQSCEQMPYLRWKIDDIFSTQTFESPIFTVGVVKFRMVYHQIISKNIYEIYMEPEVEDPNSILPNYSVKASISIVRQDEQLGGLCFTQKTESTNLNGKVNRLRHVLWLLRKQDLLHNRDKIVEGQAGLKKVTFLCVFGKLSEYQMDAIDKDAWCEEKCLIALGRDINRPRLEDDSTILLKCGNEALRVHDIILFARSGNFADVVKNKMMTRKGVEITGIEFKVLESFITYIHTGLLGDNFSTDALLIELYKTAVEYKVNQLRRLISFVLLEQMRHCIFFCSCTAVDKEELSGGKFIVLQPQLPRGIHFVNRKMFSGTPYFECKEKFSNLSLTILFLADKYRDTIFKQRIMFYLATHNSFILQSKRWDTFLSDYHKLSMEVCGAYVKYNKRFQS